MLEHRSVVWCAVCVFHTQLINRASWCASCFRTLTKKCHRQHVPEILQVAQVIRAVRPQLHQCPKDNKWHYSCKWHRPAIKQVSFCTAFIIYLHICIVLALGNDLIIHFSVAELSPGSSSGGGGSGSGGGASGSGTSNNGPARSRDRNERGETAMHVAAIKGDQDGIKKLLEQGMGPNVADFAG